jgi:hypothetical protein
MTLLNFRLFLCFIVMVSAGTTRARGQTLQNVVVNYPSKSITSFPILETARRKGFFQQQGLNMNLAYMRGGSHSGCASAERSGER